VSLARAGVYGWVSVVVAHPQYIFQILRGDGICVNFFTMGSGRNICTISSLINQTVKIVERQTICYGEGGSFISRWCPSCALIPFIYSPNPQLGRERRIMNRCTHTIFPKYHAPPTNKLAKSPVTAIKSQFFTL
jgi:hypothetical protein